MTKVSSVYRVRVRPPTVWAHTQLTTSQAQEAPISDVTIAGRDDGVWKIERIASRPRETKTVIVSDHKTGFGSVFSRAA